MAATKGAPGTGENSMMRRVLFGISIALCLLCVYFMLDFQTSAQAKLSGELILGQVDSVTLNHQGSPVISFLFEYFGAMSYFLALMIAYLGYYLVLRPVDIWHVDFYRASLRVLGFDLTLIGLCALCSSYGELGATGAGGLLGDMLLMFSSAFLPSLVSVVLFAFIAFSGLAYLCGKSPFFVFDYLGATFFKAMPGAKDKDQDQDQVKDQAQDQTEPSAEADGAAYGATLTTAAASTATAAPERARNELEQAQLATQGLNPDGSGHMTLAQFEASLVEQGELEPEEPQAAAAAQPELASELAPELASVSPELPLEQPLAQADVPTASASLEETFMRSLERSVAQDEQIQAASGAEAALPAGGSFFEQVMSGNPTLAPGAPVEPVMSGAGTAAPFNGKDNLAEGGVAGSAWTPSSDATPVEAQQLEQSLQRSLAGDEGAPEQLDAETAQTAPWNDAAVVRSMVNQRRNSPDGLNLEQEASGAAALGRFNTAQAYGQGDLNYWQGQGALAEAAFKQAHAMPQPAPVPEAADPATDPNEVHTKIVRGPDPIALKQQQEAEAQAEQAAAADAAAEVAAASAQAQSAAVTPRAGAELSPYGYGTYAAEQAQDTSAVLPQAPDESGADSASEEDSGSVHTIVQRVDPKVFAAEQEARRRKREEAERQEAERKEAERKEAERKAQAEQERLAQEQAQAEAAAAHSAEDAAYDVDEEPEDEDEDEDDGPIYAGTYAAQLEREQNKNKPHSTKPKAEYEDETEDSADDGPQYITPGVPESAGTKKRKKKKARAAEPQLAEPNTHEIGVRLPEELRPHTIIRDTRKEFEAAQAAKAAAAAAAAAATAAASTTAAPPDATATVAAPEVGAAGAAEASAVASEAQTEAAANQGPSTIIMRSEPVAAPAASTEPAVTAVPATPELSAPVAPVATAAESGAQPEAADIPATSDELSVGAAVLGRDAGTSSDILKELSSLASEFKDATEGSLSSFRSDQESSALSAMAASELTTPAAMPSLHESAAQPDAESSAPAGAPASADISDSTHIMMGSGAPEQGFNAHEANTRTNIMRSGVPTRESDDDNDFYRFALARSNDTSAPKGSVEVNLMGADGEFASNYMPEHAYDFGGKGQQAGAIDERLSGTAASNLHDDDFVTGAAHPVESAHPVRTKNFNFADLAKAKAHEQGISEQEALNLNHSSGSSVTSSAPQSAPAAHVQGHDNGSADNSDNIIDFANFGTKQPSYEVDQLSAAFIPAEDEGCVSGTIGGVDLSTVVDVPGPDLEPESESDSAPEVAPTAAAADKAEADDRADDADEADDDAEESYDEEYEDEAGADESYAAGQMGGMGMYPNMPQGQQMQYMQLPNGQYVPMMAHTMAPNMMGMTQPNMMGMGMMPNMGMGQMQYMQLPNGQLVPVMGQNMAQGMTQGMAQGMVYPNMTPLGQMAAGAMQGQMSGQMPGQMTGQLAAPLPGAMPTQVPGQLGGAGASVNQVGQMQLQAPESGAALAPTAATDAASGSSQAAPPATEQALAHAPADAEDSAAAPELSAHTMGAHGPSGVGLPTAGNAFMGAHNSSSTNLPSYMAGISSDSLSSDVKASLSLCTVPRHHYNDWRPGLELLARNHQKVEISYEELDKTAERINTVLHSYGIKAQVADYLTGPVITRYDLDLVPGVKSSAISSIETELCRNLMVPNVRVVPIIEGSSYVGLEVPNSQRQFITLGDMAVSREFQESKASLPMCLGASVIGEPVVKDLAESPHLLVAGTTGSGKSAGLNTMLISLLLKRSPAELRLILVDPKQLEFSIYKDLPHLITPVITDVAEKTPIALRWCVDEMERRFKLMSLLGVRKLAEYNELIKSKRAQGTAIPDPLWTMDMGPQPQSLEPLPWIVVVVEEFADLMAQSGRKKDRENTPESLIARLSAKSRAAGIHLVLVTQTPRSEVVTGMIKANFPSRVAFTVQNRLDSSIVLDEKGAECLLGNGDMLYKFTGSSTATRAHGAFTSNSDVEAVVSAWRDYAGAPEYLEDVIAVPEEPSDEAEAGDKPKELDVKFDQAVQVVRDYMESMNKVPTVTDLQTELGVGYPRAKKIQKQLISEGIID